MIRSIMILLLSACSTTTVVSAEYKESDLGSLFTTPSGRTTLDTVRSDKVRAADTGSQRSSPNKLTVNGIVKRSDGKSTVWLNGRSDLENRTIDGVKVLNKQRRKDSVAIYVDGKLVRIKPGESWTADKAGD